MPKPELPNSWFQKYPDWVEYYRSGLAAYNKISPTSYPDQQGFAVLAGNLMSYMGNLSGKGDYRYQGFEIINAIEGHKKYFSTSALGQRGTLYVVRQLLTAQELWTDEALRFFVVDHLYDKDGIRIYDFGWMLNELNPKVPNGNLASQEEAVGYVELLSNMAYETVCNKDPIHIFRSHSVDNSLPNVRPRLLMPGMVNMGQEAWEHFLQTDPGLTLAAFSAVKYFLLVTNHPSVETDLTPVQLEHAKWVGRYDSMVIAGLASYPADPAYQKFDQDPYGTINKAVKSLIHS